MLYACNIMYKYHYIEYVRYNIFSSNTYIYACRRDEDRNSKLFIIFYEHGSHETPALF